MNRKKIIFIFIFIGCLVAFSEFVGDKGSYANEIVIEDELDIDLEYNEDKNILKNDLFNFIDLIDNSLFAMSSFNMSDTLNENYDFLTNFAISFILNNEEVYKNEIIVGDEYVYIDGFGNKNVTNKYVSIDLIYDITNSIFGKRDYLIINEHLEISDEVVPLLLIKDNISFMEIEKIVDFSLFVNEYNVYVKYKDIDLEYIYVFKNIDEKLVLINILVEE